MKILIASFTFPPEVGGVAEVARTQAAGLLARGHEVMVATTFDAKRRPEHAPPGVPVRQFQITGNFQIGHGYAGEVNEYQTFIAEAAVDVVLFHCWQNWTVDVAAPVFTRTRARKVMLSHGVDAQTWKPHSRPPWGLGVWLRSQPYVWRLPRLMRTFDRIVLLSAQRDRGRFYDVSLAQRVCPERVAIIPNGVHLGEFSKPQGDFRKTYGIGTKHLVLNVANYDDRKNQLATLQDFMATDRDDATLVFIGGEFNEYQARVAAAQARLRKCYPRARVLFLEKVPKPMIYAAYHAADLFILSAKHETQPLAILDAMAARVPFLSTNTGCVREFPGGRVLPTGSETTCAIQQLLDDEGLRRQLGQHGRTACETNYDWGRVLDAYEKLFASLKSAS